MKCPEQRCQRDIDRDQRGRDEGHLGLKRPESAVDILGENPKETIDDAGAAHVLTRLPTLEGTARPVAADLCLFAARAPGNRCSARCRADVKLERKACSA